MMLPIVKTPIPIPIPAQAPLESLAGGAEGVTLGCAVAVSVLLSVPSQIKLAIIPFCCCETSFEQLKSFHGSMKTVPVARNRAGKILCSVDLATR